MGMTAQSEKESTSPKPCRTCRRGGHVELYCNRGDCPKHTATFEGALANALTCVDQLKMLITRGYTLANEPTTSTANKQRLYRLIESVTDTVGRLEMEGRQ